MAFLPLEEEAVSPGRERMLRGGGKAEHILKKTHLFL